MPLHIYISLFSIHFKYNSQSTNSISLVYSDNCNIPYKANMPGQTLRPSALHTEVGRGVLDLPGTSNHGQIQRGSSEAVHHPGSRPTQYAHYNHCDNLVLSASVWDNFACQYDKIQRTLDWY